MRYDILFEEWPGCYDHPFACPSYAPTAVRSDAPTAYKPVSFYFSSDVRAHQAVAARVLRRGRGYCGAFVEMGALLR
jgi:hypothetical protein